MKTSVSDGFKFITVVVRYEGKYYRGLLDEKTNKLTWGTGYTIGTRGMRGGRLSWYLNEQNLDKEQVPEEVVNKIKDEITKVLI